MKKLVVVSCIISSFWNIHPIGEPSKQHLHNYFMASYDQYGGKLKQAYERYKEMLAAGAPAYVYKGYVHLLYDTGNYAHILQIIPQLDKLFEDDSDIQRTFAQVFERSGSKDEADDRFIKLNDKFKTDQEIAFNAANSYLRRKEPKNAIKVIQTLLNNSPKKPNNFIFYFMLAQIHIQLDEKIEALKNVQKSLEMHPRFDKAWLLFGLLQEQSGQLKDAIKGYANFLEVSPSANREVEQHLLQLIFKQKMVEQHTNKALVLNKHCFEKALSLFEQKNYKKALDQIDICLAEKPLDDETKLLKIQVLSSMNQLEKAAQTLKEWMLTDPNNALWYKTLHVMTQSNLGHESAIKILHSVEKQHPDNLLTSLYLADLYGRTHHTDSANAYLKKALNLTTDNNLKSKILFQLAMHHYASNNFKAFKEIITQTNTLGLTFAPLLNIIAYYYVTQENKSEEAQQLINNVLQHDKNNPHFLDTQAYIYFKQKKYDLALNLLEKIAQKAPSDYTILVHLAQVRYESGAKDQALQALQNAQRHAISTHEKHECEILFKQWKHQIRKM